MVNAHNLITLGEIRREELLQQAEQLRLVKQATSLNRNRQPRGSDLRAAVKALGTRIDAMRRRRDVTKPIDLTPAAPETT